MDNKKSIDRVAKVSVGNSTVLNFEDALASSVGMPFNDTTIAAAIQAAGGYQMINILCKRQAQIILEIGYTVFARVKRNLVDLSDLLNNFVEIVDSSEGRTFISSWNKEHGMEEANARFDLYVKSTLDHIQSICKDESGIVDALNTMPLDGVIEHQKKMRGALTLLLISVEELNAKLVSITNFVKNFQETVMSNLTEDQQNELDRSLSRHFAWGSTMETVLEKYFPEEGN